MSQKNWNSIVSPGVSTAGAVSLNLVGKEKQNEKGDERGKEREVGKGKEKEIISESERNKVWEERIQCVILHISAVFSSSLFPSSYPPPSILFCL